MPHNDDTPYRTSTPTGNDRMSTHRRTLGTVKRFFEPKGWGFLLPVGSTAAVFVHYTDIEGTGHKSLPEGAPVEFEIGQDAQGRPKAMAVRLVSE